MTAESILQVVAFAFERLNAFVICLEKLFEVGYGNRIVAGLIPELVGFPFVHFFVSFENHMFGSLILRPVVLAFVRFRTFA